MSNQQAKEKQPQGFSFTPETYTTTTKSTSTLSSSASAFSSSVPMAHTDEPGLSSSHSKKKAKLSHEAFSGGDTPNSISPISVPHAATYQASFAHGLYCSSQAGDLSGKTSVVVDPRVCPNSQPLLQNILSPPPPSWAVPGNKLVSAALFQKCLEGTMPSEKAASVDSATIINDQSIRTPDDRWPAVEPNLNGPSEVTTPETSVVEGQLVSQAKKRSSTRRSRASMSKRAPTGPTRLRQGRPVEAQIPMDIWHLVLPYCPGKFLARARQINKDFQRALSYDSIWKLNRWQRYGSALPEPFPGMTEEKYTNLLEGLGCMSCGDRKTRKTYWLWQRRWCFDCMQSNSYKHEEAVQLLDGYPDELLDCCIPWGVVDAWGKYEFTGNAVRIRSRQGHPGQKVFGKEDISKILDEWENFTASTPSPKPHQEMRWFRARRARRDLLLARVQQIEGWEDALHQSKLDANLALKRQRITYFETRALELEPPLDRTVLMMLPAFKRSVKIPREPNQRAWSALLPKLLSDAPSARKAVAADCVPLSLDDELGYEPMEIQKFVLLDRHHKPELQLLAYLTQEVLKSIDNNNNPRREDADVVVFALREVQRRWQRCIEGADYPGITENQLTLAETRWVWEHEILPAFVAGARPMRALTRAFQCPICHRSDVKMRFNFDGLFMHLLKRHSPGLGTVRDWFGHSHRFVYVRWFDIPWPVNLPMLADHHRPSGQWDPEDVSPYLEAPKATAPTYEADFFEGRSCRLPNDVRDDLTENIVRAADALKRTKLDAKLKTKIALRYALDVYGRLNLDRLPPTAMEDILFLPLTLFRFDYDDLFNGFSCAACPASEPRLSRQLTKARAPASLFDHFHRWHQESCWYADMIKLPSDEELWTALSKPGMKEVMDAYETLYPPKVPLSVDNSDPQFDPTSSSSPDPGAEQIHASVGDMGQATTDEGQITRATKHGRRAC